MDGKLYYYPGLLILISLTINKIFLILSGYGNAGRLIAELLLQETPVQLVLAGRNLEQDQWQAQRLNQKFNTWRVTGAYVDAADLDNLKAVLAANETIRIKR